jgi:AcrR family transcriptional regulator
MTMKKGEHTRREIVERAFALAGDLGLESVTLGTLAESLGLSKSGLFAHFKSKEALQLAVFEYAVDLFTRTVVAPTLQSERGEARLNALFELYLAWIYGPDRRGRCFFIALAQEYDDRPGVIRDRLLTSQRDWFTTIARVTQGAITAGHFRADIDSAQFAHEFMGIALAFQHSYKILGDPKAEERARIGFAELIARSRPPGASN